jgi:hypothetical protein
MGALSRRVKGGSARRRSLYARGVGWFSVDVQVGTAGGLSDRGGIGGSEQNGGAESYANEAVQMLS